MNAAKAAAESTMSSFIFVDTGAWFSSVITTDVNHSVAVGWLGQNKQPLVTTDYVVDELLTLLRVRGEEAAADILGTQLFSGQIAQLYYISEEDILSAWQIFRGYNDKEWSFTDCTSKVVIEKLGLTQAFVFDHHFRQFGNVVVLP